MSEPQERPRVGEMEIEVSIGNQRERRRGAILDDVLRAIVWDFKHDNGYTQLQTAARLGLTQQNVARILGGNRGGTSIDALSRICIALKRDPVALFRMHERFRYDQGEAVRYAEDSVFDRFRSVLTVDEARDLLQVIDDVKATGALSDGLKALRKMLGKHPEKQATISVSARKTKG